MAEQHQSDKDTWHHPTKEDLEANLHRHLDDGKKLADTLLEGKSWDKTLSKILLQMINVMIALMGLCIMIAGAAALEYDVAATWVAKMLLAVGVFLAVLGGVGAYGAKKASPSLLTSYFMVMVLWFLVLMMMLLLCLSFGNSLKMQVMHNWEQLELQDTTYESVEARINSNFTALAILSLMTAFLILLAQLCVVDLVGMEHLAPPLLKLLNLLLVLAGVMMLGVAGAAGADAGAVGWSAWLLFISGIVWVALAILGYKASIKNEEKWRLPYFGSLTVMLFLVLLLGLLTLAFAENVDTEKFDNLELVHTVISNLKACGSLALLVVLVLFVCAYCMWRVMDRVSTCNFLLAFSLPSLGLTGFILLNVAAKVLHFADDTTDHQSLSSDDELFLQAASGMVATGVLEMLVAAAGGYACYKRSSRQLWLSWYLIAAVGLLAVMFCTLTFAGKVGLRDCLKTLFSQDYIDSIQNYMSVIGVFGIVSLALIAVSLFAISHLRQQYAARLMFLPRDESAEAAVEVAPEAALEAAPVAAANANTPAQEEETTKEQLEGQPAPEEEGGADVDGFTDMDSVVGEEGEGVHVDVDLSDAAPKKVHDMEE